MTLGGFALAVGILVDNSTVVIENIERHVKEGDPLRLAVVSGCGEVAVPTALSTLCICIVFVPVFLLQGTAKYLFSPLSLSVCVSLIASLALSFTLVPVLFSYLMRSQLEHHAGRLARTPHERAARGAISFSLIHHEFESGFNSMREGYRNVVAFCVGRSGVTSGFLPAA